MADLVEIVGGQDSFNGGPGDDSYAGTPGADTISGNGGNDTLAGAGGGDTIDGGDGDDKLYSASISPAWSHSYYYIAPVIPLLDTGSEVDTLRGGAGYDTFFAGYGDNVDGGADGGALLISLQGATSGVTVDFNALNNNGSLTIGGGIITNISTVQWVDGSNYNDVITGSSFGSVSPDIRGLGGDDRLIAGTATSNLYGGDGNDILDGRNSAYGGYYYGEAGDDTIYISGPPGQADGGDGNDTFYGYGTMYGGAGNDTFNLTGPNYYPTTVYGDAGDDTINGTANGGSNILYGGAGADIIHAGDGQNRLYSAGVFGPFALDDIDRGTEHDQLFGGADNDLLSIGYGDDADGGGGNNTLILSLIGATAGTTFDGNALLAGSVTIGGGSISHVQAIQQVYGSAFADIITMPTQTFTANVDGGAGDDQLTGGGSAVVFSGGDGNDRLVGSSAADSLTGGAGVDSVSGGGGDDTIFIATGDTAAGDTIDGGDGFDTVNAAQSYYVDFLDLSGTTFSNVEALVANAVSLTLAQLGAFKSLQTSSINLLTGGNIALAGVTLSIGGTITFANAATTLDMTGASMGSVFGYTINGGSGADVITTLDGIDSIDGGAGDDVINSGGGADILTGGTGRDTFHAGDGNDRIAVTAGDYVAGEVYDGGAGDDMLIVANGVDISASTLTSIESLGFDLAGSIAMTGAQLQNLAHLIVPGYSGYVSEVVNLTTGGTIAYGGTTDLATFNLAAADTVFSLSGVSSTLGMTVNGNSGNDTITGSQFGDTLNGGGGNDILDGAAGADTMSGGTGNDIYYVDNGGDVVSENSNAGTDEVRTTLASYTLTTDVENLTALLSTGQALNGNTLANILTGGAGDDVLDGKAGADTMIGGTGNDIYYVDNGGDVVTEQTGAGTDEVRTTLASYTLAANVEKLTGLLATAQALTGNALDNVITGGNGDDVLNGGGGTGDVLHGGTGDDSLAVTSNTDLALTGIFDGGTGSDSITLSSTVSGTYINLSGATLTSIERLSTGSAIAGLSGGQLGAGFAQIAGTVQVTTGGAVSLGAVNATGATFLLSATDTQLDGSAVLGSGFTVSGAAGNDTIAGGIGNDNLSGGAGDDTINGGNGNDTLHGGIGRDTLHGGAGNDEFDIDSGSDVVAGEVYDGGDGSDSIVLNGYNADFSGATLMAIERIDTMNHIATLTGAQLAGFGQIGPQSPADIAIGQNFVLSDSGAVTLTSQLSSLGLTIDLSAGGNSIDLSGMTTTSSNAHFYINGHEGDDYVIGGKVGNVLNGGGGSDTLVGGAGLDILDGGTGTDRLYGGLGNDTYHVDRQDDLVFENANEGADTVISTANFYLYANIENLILAAGAGNIFGVGNELDNTITGNEGDNTLLAGVGADIVHAGAGVDIVYGEAGDDQLFGDAGNDFLAGGDGNDVIDGGTGGDSIYGEAGNDTLYGGSDFVFDRLVGGDGNDVLHGDSGLGDYDYLYGNAGDDSFYVDTGDDLTFEQPGEGNDTVYANVAGTNNGVYLYANIENLVLLGTTSFGVGNELDNHLTGNAVGNYLLGGAGNDMLNGKEGNDVLFGEAGADTFVFEHGTGGDVIGDFQVGIDKIDLSAIGFADYQAVVNSMHEVNGTTAIDLGGGDFIVLNGITEAQLHAGDFILTGGTGTTAAPVAATVQGVEGRQVGPDAPAAAPQAGDAAQAAPVHAWALDIANDNGALHVPWHEAIVTHIDTSAIAM